MKCSQVRQLLCSSRAGEAPERQKSAVSEHLAGCADCRLEQERLNRLATELNLLEGAEAGPYFLTRVKQRIADRAAPRRMPWFRRIVLPLGGMAMVLLAILAGTRLGETVYAHRTQGTLLAAATTASYSESDLFETPAGSMLQVCDRLFAGESNE